MTRKQNEKAALVREAKKNGCAGPCGTSIARAIRIFGFTLHPADVYEMFDMDHLPGMKKAGNISDMVRSAKFEVFHVEQELAKCECLCRNCHSGRTVGRKRAKK